MTMRRATLAALALWLAVVVSIPEAGAAEASAPQATAPYTRRAWYAPMADGV
jgi:hypothetical protein